MVAGGRRHHAYCQLVAPSFVGIPCHYAAEQSSANVTVQTTPIAPIVEHTWRDRPATPNGWRTHFSNHCLSVLESHPNLISPTVDTKPLKIQVVAAALAIARFLLSVLESGLL